MPASHAVLAALLLSTALPVMGAPYDRNPFDGDQFCGNERLDDGDGIECWPVTGPGSHIDKRTGGVPFGYCTTPDAGPANIYACTAHGTTMFGAAFFDGAAFTPEARQRVSVWAEWTGGTFPSDNGGFLLVLCNDRDHDDTCSTMATSVSPDQVWQSTSNEPAVGADCSDADKDLKECPDPTDAEIQGVCLKPDLGNAWQHLQVRAYIATWSDSSPDNLGSGYSTGGYEVWLRNEGPC